MSSLFSPFDPVAARFLIPINWIGVNIRILLLPSYFWVRKNHTKTVWSKITKYVDREFKAILGRIRIPGSTFIFVRLFTFLGLINFTGLMPYIFPVSRHLVFSVSLALPLWIGHITLSWIKQPNYILAHLVPLGTPKALLPFIVLIELISRIIRPLTLSVRLAANIIAGHLLLALIGGLGSELNSSLVRLLLIGLMLLCLLERAVAVIQAYVFRILSTLYVREVQSKNLY